jgi:nucleoside-diphosphate-sugar epimerase
MAAFAVFLSVCVMCPALATVLVVGASGRLGSQVVRSLLARNIPVRALVRKQPSEMGVEVVIGDVSDLRSLVEATRGCSAVICVHGMSPLRFSRPSDLFRQSSDANHPYNVNYKGTCNVIAAMKMNDVSKLVRITGSAIGRGDYYIFKALFNLLLSFTIKWHERTEIAIREAGIDYTIIRPNELTREPPARDSNRTLILTQASKSGTGRS